ncbi:MAG: hypothetical protein GX567_11945 [Clostridia bacterium]|nr:hypothetical protein [Clostridia bacterium]
MKIPALHYAISDDDIRPALESVWVGKEDTVATNGHILVVHKTKTLFGEEFANSVPEEGIRLTRRMIIDIRKREVEEVRLSEDKTMITLLPSIMLSHILPTIGYKLPKDIPAMPDYKKVIPKKAESKPIDKIKFNPNLIDDLHKAMSPDPRNKLFLIFYFRSADKGCLVIPSTDDPDYKDSYAVIMPAML